MSRAGTTLLELLAALGLMAVLVSAGALGMVALLAHVRLAGAAEELAGALRLARVEALARHAPVELAFAESRDGWVLRAAGAAPLRRAMLPALVTLGALPARARIRFGPLGTADNASVELLAGSGRRRVVVNQRGRVRSR